MKIKICGLFRDEDTDYVNEARPDYAGFVFAESRRQVSPGQAEHLRSRLAAGIVPVGVFVNAPAREIAALYRSGIIDMAQLHGSEDEDYISGLKEICGVPVIKVLLTTNRMNDTNAANTHEALPGNSADYYLFDSGAGSGKAFDWDLLKAFQFTKPWFLAGGINLNNIKRAMALNPYGIDISSGAETEGIKDREKILQLTAYLRQ